MSDTDQNIAYIRTHVDNIERMQWFQLASSPTKDAYVKEEFAAKKHSAGVYLALGDGPRSQDELMKSTKMSRANISKILTHLEGLHWIDSIRTDRKLLFKWTDAENILKLSKIAKPLAK
ncbi:MAG TPA: hypothetical protein VNL17_12420 [Verrucomicrobiae bacterium]|nr:hypothetical protein [Verrucomicrobiae bacterium]